MTVWIAKLLGPVVVALSIPMLLAPAGLNETTRRFLSDPPLVLISGVLAMTAGLATVNSHNVWVLGWPVIVTLFGWALTLGGAIRVAAPQLVVRIGSNMLQHALLTRGAGAVWLLLGLVLCFKAYR